MPVLFKINNGVVLVLNPHSNGMLRRSLEICRLILLKKKWVKTPFWFLASSTRGPWIVTLKAIALILCQLSQFLLAYLGVPAPCVPVRHDPGHAAFLFSSEPS